MKAASVLASKEHAINVRAKSDHAAGARRTARPRVGASAGLNLVDT